jgi:hypothetical protein
MLAVAYRNLVEGPTGLGGNTNRAVREVFAHAGRLVDQEKARGFPSGPGAYYQAP